MTATEAREEANKRHTAIIDNKMQTIMERINEACSLGKYKYICKDLDDEVVQKLRNLGYQVHLSCYYNSTECVISW